jgi:general secretion pathway protein K
MTPPPDCDGDSPSTNEHGFVLVPVLFTVALLSLVALSMSQSALLDVRVAALNTRRAQTQALADGVANLAMRRLHLDRSAGRDRAVLPVDGTGLACSIGGGRATITVHDTSGLVDLNRSSLEILQRLFAGTGLDDTSARALAAATVDFRDSDDIATTGGAERAEYAAGGLAHGPKNAPFASVDELDQVLGMTADTMARVRPLVTVHSQTNGIDLEIASPAVRALGLPTTPGAKLRGNSYILRVALDRQGTARVIREAVVSLAQRSATGAAIRQWATLDPEFRIGDDAPDRGSCLDLLL